MVQVKKASKYGKYFLFLALTFVVSLVWSSKNEQGGQSNILPPVPHAYADVPGSAGTGSSDDGGGGGGGDCDDGDSCE